MCLSSESKRSTAEEAGGVGFVSRLCRRNLLQTFFLVALPVKGEGAMDVVQLNNNINDALDEEQRRRFLRRVLFWLLVVVVVAAAAGGLFYFFYKRNQDKNDAEAGDANSATDTGPSPGPSPGTGPGPGPSPGSDADADAGADTNGNTGDGDTDWGLIIGSSVGGLATLLIGGGVAWYANSRNERQIQERPRVNVEHTGPPGRGKYRVTVPVPPPTASSRGIETRKWHDKEKEELKEDLEEVLKKTKGLGSEEKAVLLLTESKADAGVGRSGEVFMAVIPDNAPQAAVNFLMEAQAYNLEEDPVFGGEPFGTYTSGMEEATGVPIKEDPDEEAELTPEERAYRSKQRKNMRLLLKIEGQTRIIRMVLRYYEKRKREQDGSSEGLSPVLLLANTDAELPVNIEGVDPERLEMYIAKYNAALGQIELFLQYEQQREKAVLEGDKIVSERLGPIDSLTGFLPRIFRELYVLEEMDSEEGKKNPEMEEFKKKLYASLLQYYDEVKQIHGVDLPKEIERLHHRLDGKRSHFRGLTVFGSGVREFKDLWKAEAKEDAQRFRALVGYFRRRAQGEEHKPLEGFDYSSRK